VGGRHRGGLRLAAGGSTLPSFPCHFQTTRRHRPRARKRLRGRLITISHLDAILGALLGDGYEIVTVSTLCDVPPAGLVR
jgi:hypothetical protein